MLGEKHTITKFTKYNAEIDRLNGKTPGTCFAIGVYAVGFVLSLLNGDTTLKWVFATATGIPGAFAIKDLIRILQEKSRLKNNSALYQTLMDYEPYKGLRR